MKRFPAVRTLLLGAGLLVSAAQAQAPTFPLPVGVKYVRSLEGIDEYALPNGLKVLLFPDGSKATFTANLTYLVGSKQEGAGETGMAHLLEHMVFKGTPSHPNLPQEFSQRGANYNASTSDERTNYYATLPASDDNLKWVLDMEADRMVRSLIAKKDLDSEMTVVRNEFERGENAPFSVLYKQVLSAAFDWHPYGNATIGNRSDVENVPVDRLRAFYRRYYQPDNAVLTLAGNFDPQRALELVSGSFGKLAKPGRTLPPSYTVEPPQDGERELSVRRVGDEQILLSAYHIPSLLHPDAAPLAVLEELLGDEPSGRLYSALVQSKKATEAGVFDKQLTDPGLILFYAALSKEDDLGQARKLLLDTVESAAGTPFSEAEVQRVRTRIASAYDQALTRPESVGLTLSEYVATGDWRVYFYLRDAVQKVTPADVQRVAQTYLKSSNRTVGTFLPTAQPERVTVPAAPTAAEVLKDYVGRPALSAGETLDPDPLKLETRVTRETIGNVKAAFLPKKSRGERVELQLSLDFGNERDLRGRLGPASFVGALLTRGSQGLSRQQLRDRLEQMQTQLSVAGGTTGAVVRLSTDRAHLADALKLMQQVLRQPVFPEADFEELKKGALDGAEAGRNEPGSIAGEALARRFMAPGATRGDLRYAPTLDEAIADTKAVTLDQVKQFYADFWGAEHARLAVVGDFDPQTVRAALPGIVDGWTGTVPYERVADVLVSPKPETVVLNVPDKANAVFRVQSSFALRDDAPDAPALDVASEIFGGGSLYSRLATRLRQNEGLSYSVGADASPGVLDAVGGFSASAIYNPANRAKLEAAFRDELKKAVQSGFAAKEVEDAKTGLLQSLRLSRSGDGGILARLIGQMYLGRTFQYSADYDAAVRALTPAQVNAAFRKYIDPDNLTVVEVGTFEK